MVPVASVFVHIEQLSETTVRLMLKRKPWSLSVKASRKVLWKPGYETLFSQSRWWQVENGTEHPSCSFQLLAVVVVDDVARTVYKGSRPEISAVIKYS